MDQAGLSYGPDYQALRRLWRHGDEALGLVELAPSVVDDGYGLHPILLDACLHVAGAFVGPDAPLMLPVAIQRLDVSGRLPAAVWCRARWHGVDDGGNARVDLTVRHSDGTVLVTVTGLVLRPVTERPGGRSPERYDITWQPVAPVDGKASIGPVPDTAEIAVASGTWLVASLDADIVSIWGTQLRAGRGRHGPGVERRRSLPPRRRAGGRGDGERAVATGRAGPGTPGPHRWGGPARGRRRPAR
ncbi:polyketide synthase dehydratase domain-containing protein [Micromonospora sp. M12]